jgi:hypothetical protein
MVTDLLTVQYTHHETEWPGCTSERILVNTGYRDDLIAVARYCSACEPLRSAAISPTM